MEQYKYMYLYSISITSVSWYIIATQVFMKTIYKTVVKGIFWHFGKYRYLLSCPEFDERVDTIPMLYTNYGARVSSRLA